MREGRVRGGMRESEVSRSTVKTKGGEKKGGGE